MQPAIFALLEEEDPGQVYAYGLEIPNPAGDMGTAVVVRLDPASGQTAVGIHESAEAALVRYGLFRPLTLARESDSDTPAFQRSPC